MALELETHILCECNLGHHYNWSNGSGSCGLLRRAAGDKLPGIIQKHHDAGEEIAAPVGSLLDLVRAAAGLDKSEYELTKTWQVASEVIRAHMELHFIPAEQQSAWVVQRANSIRTHYGMSERTGRTFWRTSPYGRALGYSGYDD